jgi:hypothetical protein
VKHYFGSDRNYLAVGSTSMKRTNWLYIFKNSGVDVCGKELLSACGTLCWLGACRVGITR